MRTVSFHSIAISLGLLSFLMPGHAAFANDGDTFVAENKDGIRLTYQVLSEQEKTAEVTGLENRYYIFDDGCLTIPCEANGYRVVSVAMAAFRNNREFQTVIISEGILSVKSSSFAGCTNLKEVCLPPTITELGYESFSSSNIEKIVMHAPNPGYIQCDEAAFDTKLFIDEDIMDWAWCNNTYEDATLFVPRGSASKYAGLSPWSNFVSIQEFFEPDADVNNDEAIDISDIVAVINVISGTETNEKADVNADGKTDISDIVAVINCIAK